MILKLTVKPFLRILDENNLSFIKIIQSKIRYYFSSLTNCLTAIFVEKISNSF